jgi:hypothetical protein
MSIAKKLACLSASVTLLLILSTGPALAQRSAGSVGIGGQIGSPSGITLKIYNPRGFSYDFLAAWNLDDFFFLNIHGLLEHHIGPTQRLHFFYGPGAFIGIRDRPNRDDEVEAGISGSFGIGFVIDRLEFFGQITPRLALVPSTDGEIGGGVGLRFYF